MNLNEKLILVTGSLGLLGRAIVNELKNQGARVVGLDIGDPDKKKEGYVYCDVTKEADFIDAWNAIESDSGPIYGLVNNAYPRTKDWGIMDSSQDSINENLSLQLGSYLVLSRFAAKRFALRKEGGSIVNLASIYGVVANDQSLYKDSEINPPEAYPAIKGGVISYTKYLSAKYATKNVRVNCISPGGVFDNQPETFVQAYKNRVPMGRMANPEDISPAVCFLLSPMASYITGQNLVIDGGWTAI